MVFPGHPDDPAVIKPMVMPKQQVSPFLAKAVFYMTTAVVGVGCSSMGNNNNNNNNQFNKTTLQYIYTLNYMAKFMKYLKIIRANNCSLLVTRTCKFFKRVYTNSYILQL